MKELFKRENRRIDTLKKSDGLSGKFKSKPL